MRVEDQSEVIAFLADGTSYGHPDRPVERIRTHISEIFLVGDRSFKLKRAVKLPYLDFSTRELREAACQREVELNRRTAPALYLGVRQISRMDGRLVFGAEGEPVDSVVEMRRFDQDDLFDRMAERRELIPSLMTATAAIIARFHQEAEPSFAGSGAGAMARVLDINETALSAVGLFDPAKVEQLNAALRESLTNHAALLDERLAAGKVRRCHGDLHLRNICLLDGEPTLFDCLEFSEEMATIDVAYDLAFLLMDLWHRGLPNLANLTMNRYLDATGDDDAVPLLGLFMAIRAAIRAHVTATQAMQGDDDGGLRETASRYFDLANRLMEKGSLSLVAIGGLSGSGKSTIADAIAGYIGVPPGARVFESDRVRKRLFGLDPTMRLPPDAYRPEVSETVYGTVADMAEKHLRKGISVVVNAVFDRRSDRERIRHASEKAHAPFIGLWLDVKPDVLKARVAGRVGSASDADLKVLSLQLEKWNAAEMDWRLIDGNRELALVVGDVLAVSGVSADPPRPA